MLSNSGGPVDTASSVRKRLGPRRDQVCNLANPEVAGRGFTKATVNAYRTALESKGLVASTVNIRLSAIRKLAGEAADNGLMPRDVAAGFLRSKGVKREGVRTG